VFEVEEDEDAENSASRNEEDDEFYETDRRDYNKEDEENEE
jgi:hypothetical protein